MELLLDITVAVGEVVILDRIIGEIKKTAVLGTLRGRLGG